jgi:hypothetical protein
LNDQPSAVQFQIAMRQREAKTDAFEAPRDP